MRLLPAARAPKRRLLALRVRTEGGAPLVARTQVRTADPTATKSAAVRDCGYEYDDGEEQQHEYGRENAINELPAARGVIERGAAAHAVAHVQLVFSLA